MILHTVVPYHLMFPSHDPQHVTVIQCGGISAEAEPLGDGRYRILRLLNGQCADYLHPRLQPGQIWKR